MQLLHLLAVASDKLYFCYATAAYAPTLRRRRMVAPTHGLALLRHRRIRAHAPLSPSIKHYHH